MGLKKFGLKSGSWLLNTEPKSKSKEAASQQPNSSTTNSILDDKFVNGPEVLNSPTFRELVSNAESTLNQEYDDAESLETSSRLSRRKSGMSAPKALLRMFSSSGKKKDSIPSPTPSTHDLRRTTLSNSSVQLSHSDSGSDHVPRTSYSAPRDSTRNVSRGSIIQSPTSSQMSPNNPEEVLSPKSYASVRPFTTAAPAAAAAFTYSPTSSAHDELITSSSMHSGLSSETAKLTSPRTSGKGSTNHNLPTNGSATSIEFSQPHSISRIGLSSTSASNLAGRSPGSYTGDSQLGLNSPSSQCTTAPLSPGITSLINRGLPGSNSDEGDTKVLHKEISRLTRELAELGEDRDRQVAKIGVLRAELGRSEASLKSEQLSGRQELEALLELQAQHQLLQRIQGEREAEIKLLSTEKVDLQAQLAAVQAQLQEAAGIGGEYKSLLLERKQLRAWLDEEKERHNEVRQELFQTKALLRNKEARINHLEMVAQEREEEIRDLEKRDVEANECTQREVNYYQEQLNEALRSRDELRDELDRTKEQVRMLRRSMEQLLKAGAADDGKPATFSPRSAHSKASSITEASFLKGASMSPDSYSRSGGSDDLESITSSEFLAQQSASGCIRYGLGHERRSTFGLDTVLSEASSPYQAEPPTSPPESYEVSSPSRVPLPHTPQFSPVPTSVTSPVPEKASFTETSAYWDQRLKELLKEKERVNLEYARIPTSRITISIRKRKEDLEHNLDQLDSDIAGARSKLRALVI